MLCLFSMRPTSIPHPCYVRCAMQSIAQILQCHPQTSKSYALQMNEVPTSNHTALNHYLPDCTVTQVIYHYFFAHMMTYHTIDSRTGRHVLPPNETRSFVDQCPQFSKFFFLPLTENTPPNHSNLVTRISIKTDSLPFSMNRTMISQDATLFNNAKHHLIFAFFRGFFGPQSSSFSLLQLFPCGFLLS